MDHNTRIKSMRGVLYVARRYFTVGYVVTLLVVLIFSEIRQHDQYLLMISPTCMTWL